VTLEMFLVYFIKAFAVAMFAMNVGVILTWVERRMRGMIQDCVGPNRAGIPVPGPIAAMGALGPALGAAAAIGYLAFSGADEAPEEGWGMVAFQAAIFMLWFTTACIARVVGRRGPENSFDAFIQSLGTPRSIVGLGLVLHLVTLAVGLLVDTAEVRTVLFRAGVSLLVFSIVGGAAYVALSVGKERFVRIRLIGLLHPAADGLKTVFKGDFVPPNADKFLFNLAPFISFFPALVLLAIVPFGPALCFGSTETGGIDFGAFQGVEAAGGVCESARLSLQVADLNVGILYYFAIAGTGIVGAALAGWASDNKYSLLGGMRAASQMVSYEVTLGLTVIGALMVYGTVRVDEMVRWQAEHTWGLFAQPFAFFLFFAASVAESKRIPFDIPEGESEVVAGYFTEYSGMKFSMFFFSEFIAVVTGSTLMAAVFLGGWHLPFVTADGIRVAVGETVYFEAALAPGAVLAISALGFIGKVLTLALLQVTIRWTLPRFRYDQLMRLCWRKMLPASLVNVMATAIIMLAIDSASPATVRGLEVAGDWTMVFLAGAGMAAGVAAIVFLLLPRQKDRLVVSTAARYAEAMGGTRTAKMEA
jgi:NADH-quinone oxidoreductase subunit H